MSFRLLIACCLASGLALLQASCVMVDVSVTNPVQGLTTVAVAPFFNLSEERAVDGRLFAQAYYTELQKTPGFQVIPVGVVEQAIVENRLAMNSPADALRLADILHVDAVVLGAVTDYSPYYPPRIGLQISWYSPRQWTFYPGLPVMFPEEKGSRKKKKGADCPPGTPSATEPECKTETAPPSLMNPLGYLPKVRGQSPEHPVPDLSVTAPTAPPLPPTPPFDPTQPLMSYTRMFDGSDSKLVARLRDYVELSGDLRAGGWEAYLQRSEDFIRFTSHVMIVEMLQLHGGEAQKRVVIKMRKYH